MRDVQHSNRQFTLSSVGTKFEQHELSSADGTLAHVLYSTDTVLLTLTEVRLT